MSWLSNLLGRPSKEEQAKLDSAHEKGRQFAASMIADLDQFIAVRFGHIKKAFLDILRQNVSDAMLRVDHSPILVARADYSVFLDNVRETKVSMREEIMAHMGEWIDAFDQMGGAGQLDRAVDARLNDLELDLTTSGLTVLTDRADELKAADDSWRAKFPEQAAGEPVE